MEHEMRVCRPGDPDYPELLRSIGDPPRTLYRRGALSRSLDGVAFVGARRPTAYGLRMARRLAGGVARAGLAVISGLARGIDTQAHLAALEAGGTTWAVLGSGVDRVYPSENGNLAGRIVESGGCVLSEFAPGTPPLAEHFPRRNRIVAGLAWATVVIEGKATSGALITARLAAEQGREVLAVPGPADSELSDASFILIREGAKPVRSVDEILRELPPACRWGVCEPAGTAGQADPKTAASREMRRVLGLIGPLGSSLEELSSEAGLDFSQVSHILFQLELDGLVESLEGQRYARM